VAVSFTEMHQHLVVAVHQSDARGQIWNHQRSLALMEVARQVDSVCEAEVAPSREKGLEPVVLAVCHQQTRR
jgi:hypothetical protein